MTVRLLILTLAGSLLLAVPANARHFGEECDNDAGAELLGVEGFEVAFAAPTPPAPELAATAQPAVTAARTANFLFATDFLPFQAGDVTITLTWADPGDYDVFVFDADGFELGRSAQPNIEDGTTQESLTLELEDCTTFSVAVRSWAGGPQQLTLGLAVDELEDEDPDAVARDDDRSFYYLGGDRPGQAAMLSSAYPVPSESALVSDRPVGNQPNQYTRPLVGFNVATNPFQAHYTTVLDDTITLDGSPAVQVWLSAPSQSLPEDQAGEVEVRLFLDGSEVGEAIGIPSTEINPWPTPFLVEFEELEEDVEFDVTVQVSADPVVATDQTTAPLGDGVFTVWYDSVQYPSRLMLP